MADARKRQFAAPATPFPEGINALPLYTDADWEAEDEAADPGRPPYLRGTRPAGSSEGEWLRCSAYDHPDPATVNRQIRADLAGGVDAVWLRLDRAARLGRDGDDGEARESVGVGGVPLYDVSDFRTALDGVPLDEVTLVLDAGANALPAAALATEAAREAGQDPRGLRMHLCADPLGALAGDGRLPGSLERMEEEAAGLAAECHRRWPRARAISVSTRVYHEAGARAAEELAYALATAVHYLRRLEAAGLPPVAGAGQIGFRQAVGLDLFVEIAKLRALRWAWSKVLAGCGVEEAPAPWIHAVGSRRSLSRRDPWVNLLRGTSQVFAAVTGGADAVTASSFDAALGQPGEAGRRLARNTQAILAEESHLGRVLDPGGGSYYLESLTDSLARAGWELFREIEAEGGMARALLAGRVGERTAASWRERRGLLVRRQLSVTGVSRFADPGETLPETAPRHRLKEATADRLARHRAGRGELPEVDVPSPAGALEALAPAARAGATIGELSAGLGRPAVAGDFRPRGAVRDAEPFEELRDAADRLAAEGEPPAVLLLKLGTPDRHREGASFARRLFRTAGFRVVAEEGEPGGDLGEKIERVSPVVCICGAGDDEDEATRLLARLADAGATHWLVAGSAEAFAGPAGEVSAFLHEGADVHAVLADLLEAWRARHAEAVP